MDFSGTIHSARERLLLSRDELGHQVGVSGETIRRWEQGVNPPRTRALARRLDEVLGTDTETMLFGSLPMPGAVAPMSGADTAEVRRQLARVQAELDVLRRALSAPPSQHGDGRSRRGSRSLVTMP